jgi:hypothetical protein
MGLHLFLPSHILLACLDQPPEEKELADKVASSLLDESTPPNTLTTTSKWLFTN